ncbi:tail fiber assembly protein [Xenorhabdus thuongxuanensis]|uniref:Tail assembly chaperone n=1 Tax=Xenorhabdus thuongxuanensis TaxID=1873484 RepID=A0A1Q5TR83_9GAMM|nr:tail fiber assembly protein [Xenorhabdus thuongxuanensis]OKP02720.1 tail assembly chaperone [Xenorhabdus thuongxuanensis]
MVTKLGKFTEYVPVNPIQNGVYLYDEIGLDWYKSQKLFSRDTVKIVYYEDGSIDSYSKDVSALWPINAYISEINEKDIPENFSVSGDWGFYNGKISKRVPTDEEIIQHNTIEKSFLFDEALKKIQLWQTKLLLDIISDEDRIRLIEWTKYIQKLQDLTSLSNFDIDWPKKPE